MQDLPFIVDLLQQLSNPWVIILLMAIESSFIPFPSEIVVPPAAWMAAKEGVPGVALIVLYATIGACIGACINYFLSLWLGRPIVYKFANSRFGHMCLINEQKVQKAEAYFVEHGALGTLVGRLVPVVRQLISIPAGLARMDIRKFLLFTTIGACIWNTILCAIGYSLQGIVKDEQELAEQITAYGTELKWAMIGLGVLVVGYLIYKGRK